MKNVNYNQTETTVILVNDDVTQLNILAGLLQKSGLVVRAFQSAESALSVMESNNPPSLIITNLYMPGIDGWRFCRLLRSPEYKAFNQIPIIVVSATFSGDEATRITADLGANAFLPSPVDGKRLNKQVNLLLRGERFVDRVSALIVEDNQALALLLKKTFEANGYQANIASTAEEATQSFKKVIYDVAVIDHHLPGRKGDELLAEIQRDRLDCVCIMMTTDPGPELALAWIRQGAAAYLHKPFNPAYLLELCAKARRERALLRVEHLLEERTLELRRSEKLYRITVDSIGEAVHLVDRDLRIILFNHRFRQWFHKLGITQDVVGKPLKDVFPLLSADVLDQYRQVLETGLPIKTQEEIEIGTQLILTETNKTPVMMSDKTPGVLTTVTDITELKRAEEMRLSLERHLQQMEKAESLSRMAGAVAHYFNNMLTATIGNLDIALNMPSGTDISEELADAKQAAQRAAEMSGLMLTMLGQSRGKPESMDLSKVCHKHLSQLRAVIPENVSLETDFPSPGPVIKADLAQMNQILTSLVTNAWEAMDGYLGRLRVTAETVNQIRIEHRFPVDWKQSTNRYACLSVSDTGRGMDLKTLDRIFDPFYSDKFIGRGLGLAVLLGIVKALNGCITVESELGRGSTFHVFFPLSTEAVKRAKDEKTTETEMINTGGIVLLVEDEDIVRNVGKALLDWIGFDVICAKGGIEAVEIFRKKQADIRLVLSDLTMPHMNGWETLAASRAIRPDIRVILASGYDESRVFAEDHAEQPQAFLHKPYEIKALKAAVKKALEDSDISPGSDHVG